MTETELNKGLEILLTRDDVTEHLERKSRRRMRRTIKVRKDDALLRIINTGGYTPNRGYIDPDFDGRTLLHSGKYIKYPKNSRCQRWMKRKTSKIYRKYLALPQKGNHYRRLFDYWWTLD